MANLNDSTDQQYLTQMAAGDETALRHLFNRYYPSLMTSVRRLVADDDTCRDMVQDVFVELWNKRDALSVHTSLGAYLRRAAVNKTLNFIKQNKRYIIESPEDQTQLADDSYKTQEQQADNENLYNALHQAIDTLPPQCRLVFSLSRFEQLSHKEIAEKLGISTKTIENQITKAMKILREMMTKHHNLSAIVILALNKLAEA